MKKLFAALLAAAALVFAAPAPAEAAGTVYLDLKIAGTNHTSWAVGAMTTVDKYTKTTLVRGTCRSGVRCIIIRPGRLTPCTGAKGETLCCERPSKVNGCAEAGWAQFDGLTCTITVDTRPISNPRGSDYWHRLYAHEGAHCYDAVHEDGADTIMNPTLYYGNRLVAWQFSASTRAIIGRY